MTIYYSAKKHGFFDDKIHKKLPSDAKQISTKLRRDLLNQQTQGKEIVPDQDGNPIAVDPVPPIDELINEKHRQIDRMYQLSMQKITAGYPQLEIDGFFAQLNEVRAYRLEEQAGTPDPTNYPLLSNLAQQSGHTIADRATRIEQKYTQFATVYGALTGKRQALSDALEALDPATVTRAEIAAIDPSELTALSKTLPDGS